MRDLIFPLLLVCLFSCAGPHIQMASDTTQSPVLTPRIAVMDDGYELPLTVWRPKHAPQAIVLALHGFNDYRNAFSGLGPRLASEGIITYAYDQRGFGDTAQRGIWPGTETLVEDARTMVHLLCQRYPNLPLFLLGESMGGAVIMDMQLAPEAHCDTGVILLAPAVWGWQAMPFWQRWALWLSAHLFPGKKVTGEGLNIVASDNRDMLMGLRDDPLVIKRSRLDTIYGLTGLMESALLASSQLATPTLILYGEKDQIIPPRPVCRMLATLPGRDNVRWRLALYPDGYHMLTRDLQQNVVLEDMVSWLHNQDSALPSGLEVKDNLSRIETLCGKNYKKVR